MKWFDKKPKWHLFQDAVGEWRFNLMSTNGRIVLQSEGYKSKNKALKTIDRIVELSKLDPAVLEL